MSLSFHTERKYKARHTTVVQAYRQLARRKSIPADRQHVSLLARLEGHPWEEPSHLVSEALVRPEQIHGITHDSVVHAQNVLANAEHYVNTLNLHEGDVVAVLEQLAREGRLNPSIVNLDLMQGPAACLPPLIRSMNILAECPGPIMLVWNVILKHWQRTQMTEACFDVAIGDDGLMSARRAGGWWMVERFHDYLGEGGATMRTAIFWKSR